jgi:hypothetical protein
MIVFPGLAISLAVFAFNLFGDSLRDWLDPKIKLWVEEGASTMEELRTECHTLMFDLYGTVVDMQGGLIEAVTPYLQQKGWTGRPDALVTWWRRTHFENSMIDALLHREHTPYREIGRRALAYTLERAGIDHTQDEVRALVARIESLKPFPDVIAALKRLKKKYQLTILSNRYGHARSRTAPPGHRVRSDHLGRGGRLVQAPRGDLPNRGGAPRMSAGRHSVRCQSRVRLRGRQGLWHAHLLRRPTQETFRRLAPPAGSGGGAEVLL